MEEVFGNNSYQFRASFFTTITIRSGVATLKFTPLLFALHLICASCRFLNYKLSSVSLKMCLQAGVGDTKT